MALLPILTFPDPRLRTIASPIAQLDETITQLIDDMFETMYAASGIGLAATQVDRHVQLIVMDLSEERNEPQVFINPCIQALTAETKPYEEGCLSVPETYDMVERIAMVRITGRDRTWQEVDIQAEGLLAVCIQHEMDHLNGMLFVDHLSTLKRTRIRDKLLKAERERQKQQKIAAKKVRI